MNQTATATQEIYAVLIYPPGLHELTGLQLFTDQEKAFQYVEKWKHHKADGEPRWCMNEYLDDKRVLAEIRVHELPI